MDTIKVKTPIGTICAERATDPEHPGVFVWIELGDGTILDLVGVEYLNEYVNYNTETPRTFRPKEYGVIKDEVIAGYIYGDVYDESWTRRCLWSKGEILDVMEVSK